MYFSKKLVTILRMNFLIPCAGLGKRFNSTSPKLLIDVLGRPMIQKVLENLNQEKNDKFVCCLLSEHESKFDISKRITDIFNGNIQFVFIDALKDGPAKTCYEAKHLFDSNEDLVITNCDQVIEDFSASRFKEFTRKNRYDGILGTFFSNSPKNSYVKLNDEGLVTEVKEKLVISNYATNGFHYWKKAKFFFESCDEMFSKNDRVLNEFYVAPSYNYLINNGKKIGHYYFNEHYPIGIPEDLNKYIQKLNNE